MDQQSTYEDFIKAMHALYPGSEEEHKWLVTNMDRLVGEQLHLGVLSLLQILESITNNSMPLPPSSEASSIFPRLNRVGLLSAGFNLISGRAFHKDFS